MLLVDAIRAFLAQRQSRGLSPASVALYRRQLDDWQRWREGQGAAPELVAVSLAELDRFVGHLAGERVPHAANPRRPAARQRGLSPETVASYRRTLRALWRFAGARGWLDPGQAGFFGPGGVAAVAVPERPRPVYADLAAILAACGDGEDEVSARDRALVALLWDSGARIGELLGLDDHAVDPARRRGQVRGKGGSYRVVRWGPVAQHELVRYRQRRRGGEGGPLFRATGPRAGRATRLTADAARSRLKRLLAAAGIEPAPGSPLHAFRRGFIQRGLDDGASLADVSQLVGHQDVRTTMRYARRDEDRLDALYEAAYVRQGRRGRALEA